MNNKQTTPGIMTVEERAAKKLAQNQEKLKTLGDKLGYLRQQTGAVIRELAMTEAVCVALSELIALSEMLTPPETFEEKIEQAR